MPLCSRTFKFSSIGEPARIDSCATFAAANSVSKVEIVLSSVLYFVRIIRFIAEAILLNLRTCKHWLTVLHDESYILLHRRPCFHFLHPSKAHTPRHKLFNNWPRKNTSKEELKKVDKLFYAQVILTEAITQPKIDFNSFSSATILLGIIWTSGIVHILSKKCVKSIEQVTNLNKVLY